MGAPRFIGCYRSKAQWLGGDRFDQRPHSATENGWAGDIMGALAAGRDRGGLGSRGIPGSHWDISQSLLSWQILRGLRREHAYARGPLGAICDSCARCRGLRRGLPGEELRSRGERSRRTRSHQAVYYRKGVIRPIVSVIKALASALSIGSGGSIGREGPIIQIGSSFGSTMGQLLRLPSWQKVTLIAAGAGGGIAATFNTPIGGVLFALEIIMPEFSARTLGAGCHCYGDGHLYRPALFRPSSIFLHSCS